MSQVTLPEDLAKELAAFFDSAIVDANDLYENEDRFIDNSCSTSTEYYKTAREKNYATLESRLSEIEALRDKFGL